MLKAVFFVVSVVACIQLVHSGKCFENLIVPGIASSSNLGCNSLAYYLEFSPDIPPLCLYTSSNTGATTCAAGQTGASDYNWGNHLDDFVAVFGAITGTTDLSGACVGPVTVCPVGSRFVDLTAIDTGFGYVCVSYTCEGKCSDGWKLGCSKDFVINNGTDYTQMLWTALAYATGGKDLVNLCVKNAS